jgi:hypothetical protein
MHNLQRQNTQKQETIEQVQTSVWSIIRSLPKGATLVILVMMFFNGISCLPFQTYLSSVLVDEHGYSLSTSATSWQIIGLVGMASGFSMGWVGGPYWPAMGPSCGLYCIDFSHINSVDGEC